MWTHVSFGGHSFDLYGHEGDYVRQTIDNWGVWEPRITRLIEQILESSDPQEDGIVVDCGAHIGYYTILLAILGYRVISIEPLYHEEISLASKRNNVEQLVSIQRVAVGSKPGICSMRSFPQTGLSHVAAKDDPISDWHLQQGGGPATLEFDIPMTTLDELIPPDEPVLLMKVDVEGLEPEAFAGFERGLAKRVVKYVVVELTSRFLGAPACLQLAQMIQLHGYQVSDLGILEGGKYVRSDLLSQLTPLTSSAMASILETEPQTNFLFQRL